MSLEALAGLCCDVGELSKANDYEKESIAILPRVPLSRNSSNKSVSYERENNITMVPLQQIGLSRNSSNAMLNILSRTTTDISPPLLSRQASNSRNNEWVKQVTLEERCFIKDKIKVAYKKKAPTYEELLEVCAAIDEEMMFVNAPSRLDYFKNGTQFEKRVSDKVSQLSGNVVGAPSSLVPNETKEEKDEIKETRELEDKEYDHAKKSKFNNTSNIQ